MNTFLLLSLFLYILNLSYLIYVVMPTTKKTPALIMLFIIITTIRLDNVVHYTKEEIDYIKNEVYITQIKNKPNLNDIPDRYTLINTDTPVNINNGVPFFDLDTIDINVSYHNSSPLDELGRTVESNALVGKYSIQDTRNTESLLYKVPSGWVQKRYKNISRGGWLYQKVHIIPYELTGNSYTENMITGTNFLSRTLEYHIKPIRYYIEKYEMPIRMRVTPVYNGDDLLPKGLYLEAYSVEDNGKSIMINTYIPNRQAGIDINYKNGTSDGPELILPIEPESITPKDKKNQIRA